MPNIAVTIRQEVIRLARREIRIQMRGLRKATSQFRRDIAEIKRNASSLKFEVLRLERRITKNVAPQIEDADATRVRFTAKGVSSHRKGLGISAADYGKLIGATAHTVYKWEHGTSRPRKAQVSSLAAIRHIGKPAALARLEQMRKKSPKTPAPKR